MSHDSQQENVKIIKSCIKVDLIWLIVIFGFILAVYYKTIIGDGYSSDLALKDRLLDFSLNYMLFFAVAALISIPIDKAFAYVVWKVPCFLACNIIFFLALTNLLFDDSYHIACSLLIASLIYSANVLSRLYDVDYQVRILEKWGKFNGSEYNPLVRNYPALSIFNGSLNYRYYVAASILIFCIAGIGMGLEFVDALLYVFSLVLIWNSGSHLFDAYVLYQRKSLNSHS